MSLEDILKQEADAITDAIQYMGNAESICEGILSCKGNIVVSGVGKSGLVGQKISATLSSTGSPSIFLSPTDAMHGDLGRVAQDDIALLLSNSGDTAELVLLARHLLKIGCTVYLITGKEDSELATLSHKTIAYKAPREAGIHGLAPSCSTTVQMAIGDAIALHVMQKRSFSPADYARYHPGGALAGKTLTAKDLAREIQNFQGNMEVGWVAKALALHHSGLACITTVSGEAIGIVTIADCCRDSPSGRLVINAMTYIRNAVTCQPTTSVGELMSIMRDKRVNQIPVIDKGKATGLVDIQDIVGLRLNL